MIRESMTGVERRHRWLMVVYCFGAALAVAVSRFPSFLCRAGSAVLLVGLAYMFWSSRPARRSVLFYVPFFVGTNLMWMGMPLPVDAVSKAVADCGFLAVTVLLLSVLYFYNCRVLNALSDPNHLGNNPHSEAI